MRSMEKDVDFSQERGRPLTSFLLNRYNAIKQKRSMQGATSHCVRSAIMEHRGHYNGNFSNSMGFVLGLVYGWVG